MERRYHTRIPVELNAVLIGEKTVPRGCKVANLSQQGILLECVRDGRVATFKEGNIANVHLLFQQSGGCKYLTKTADVKHVSEGRIGVEFHHPDSNLVEFTRSCSIEADDPRDAQSASLSSPLTDGTDLHTATNADFIHAPADTAAGIRTGETDMKTGNHRMVFFAGLIFMLIAAGLILGAYLYATRIDNRISALETVTDNHTGKIAEMQEWAFPASMMEGKFAYLNAQMKALNDSFTKLESRLAAQDMAPPTDSLATPVARTASSAAGAKPSTATPEPEVQIVAPTEAPPATPVARTAPPEADAKPSTATPEPEVQTVAPAQAAPARPGHGETTRSPAPTKPAGKPPAAVAKKAPASKPGTSVSSTVTASEPSAPVGAATGAWIINLASSPDKAAAEKFAARAWKQDIPVVLVKADVKGRDYWRVQLTGFASRKAARSYAAGPVREKLGLKDVWILRQ